MSKIAIWSMFWWISEELNNQKRNSLSYNNPVQYWTSKLFTCWWDSGDCQSWEKWAQLNCTLKDSYEPSQYEVPILQRVRHHNMEVLHMWNVHGEGQVEISKDLKIMQNLQLKIYLKVIFCEYGQGLGKNVVNWFLLLEVKYHQSILLICLAALIVNSGFSWIKHGKKFKKLVKI
jgi:hypothetical protein